MKAAQHGKNFLSKDEFNFNHFVILTKDLRILNNLRRSEKPRLITYDQYKKLEVRQLVNRLLKQQNFFLAYEIYQFLGLNVKDIYEKWAEAYIKVNCNFYNFRIFPKSPQLTRKSSILME